MIDEIRYYPIKYLSEKLFRSKFLISRCNLQQYGKYIKIYSIKYQENNVQDVKCISEDGLKNILLHTQIARFTVAKRKRLNILLEFLGLEKVTEKEIEVKYLKEEEFELHNEYIKDIIKDIYYNDKNMKYQLCISCNKYYPQHKKFFNYHSSYKKYEKICHDCGEHKIGTKDNIGKLKEKRNIIGNRIIGKIYKKYGEEGYKKYKEQGVIFVYLDYLKNGKRLPKEICDKKSFLEIIKYLYNEGLINKNDITKKYLKEKYCLYIDKIISIVDVYKYLFGDDFYLFPWRYKCFKFDEIKLTYDIAFKIFDNYLIDNNIVIDDIFKFNYSKIYEMARVTKITQNILDFIVKYYGNKYPGYKFKIHSVNYYKDKNNRDFDLKYLVEEDMKIPLEKIPLYLTKMGIRKVSETMYNVLKKYYKNMFEWINEIYPGKFIEADFIINIYRNDFQSEDEAIIHDALKDKLKNVIYNRRYDEDEICINNMIPDWFVFTNGGVWIIEYFGNYVEKGYNNKRVNQYKERVERKINKYKDMCGYMYIYLYPEDMKDNMRGLYKKISVIN